MNGDDLTPTKTVSRVNLSPNSKEVVCVLCVEGVLNPNYRPKLFSGFSKSPACVNLEVLVGAKLYRESCMTDIICRNCDRTNENVVKKILEVRQQFSSSKEKLAAERGSVESVKRQNKADSTNQVRGKHQPCTFHKQIFNQSILFPLVLQIHVINNSNK